MPTHTPRRAVGLVLAGLLVAACGSGGTATTTTAGFPLSFENCAEQVTIGSPPQRVVILGPEAIPLLAAAGALDRVVARAGELPLEIYPAEYRSAVEGIRVIGGDATSAGTAQITLESVIAEAPDLVIGYEPRGTTVTRSGLAGAGIPMMVIPSYCTDRSLQPNPTFDDVYAQIELYGRVFGTPVPATTAADTARRAIESVTAGRQGNPGRTAAALFVPVGGGALSAYGDASMADAQMEAVGLRNVFRDVRDRVIDVGIEEVLARNPDVLILLHVTGTPDEIEAALRAYPGVESLAAVRDDRLLALQFEYTDPPTPLSVAGLQRLDEQFGSP